MTDVLHVTAAQVLAAQLAVELCEEAGEAPDEALKAIANAQVATPQQLASHRTSADERTLSDVIDRLQRIEDRLQKLIPEVSGQERSQPPSPLNSPTRDEQSIDDRGIQDPTLANVDPQDLAPPPWYPDLDPPTWPSEEVHPEERSEVARPRRRPPVESPEQPAGVNPDDLDGPQWAPEKLSESEFSVPTRPRRTAPAGRSARCGTRSR